MQAFLQSNFSPLTGCLPNREELDRDLRQGRVLTLEEGGAITGLLHFSLVGNTGEIRHLAVRSDLRGTGAHPPSAGRVSPCHRRCQKCCVDPL